MKHFFFKGQNNILSDTENSYDDSIPIIKKEIGKILETRNLSFLIGSGCSLGKYGIPTMIKLAESFYTSCDILESNDLILDDELREILIELKVDISKEPFKSNLETFLGALYSLRFYCEQIDDLEQIEKVSKVIKRTKKFILHKCLNEENAGKDGEILDNYKMFYRKLSLRDSNLPKPNIFTTNYDLYSEQAMDELGITYTNGFSGFLERFFNPSIFNYALAEQMNISSYKWNVIDSFIYLFKIHGSVNWVENTKEGKLFRIRELQDVDFDRLSEEENLMIYPSPIKQNSSLGTPYSDLFREFQKRITQQQSVLVTMGYSFSDEHINNLVYQALTIPTFRVVIFSDVGYKVGEKYISARKNIEQLKKLNDPRIWIIGSDKEFEDDQDWNETNESSALFHFNNKRFTSRLVRE